jgi:hypothetical protein
VRATILGVVLVAAGVAALGGFETGDGIPAPPEQAWHARNEALTRAHVFRHSAFDASAIDFADDPNEGVVDASLTTCRYQPDEISGTTPKFDCELPNGERIKVKYGWTNEIPSEIISTRLLHGLGFGADRVSLVETVRCYGCPFQPFHSRSLAEFIGLVRVFDRHLDYTRPRDFHRVSAERNLEGEAIEVGKARGWAFWELKRIDPSRGGATRAEVDALRLMAVLLHHWDNKTANQRLVCAGADTADCAHPLAMIQDAGSDFGPKKLDLDNWKARPVWHGDPSACMLSMKGMPFGGGTFEDVAISEDGRKLLGERLRQLSPEHLETLFSVAKLDGVADWVSAFQEKVRQIVHRPACPALSRS